MRATSPAAATACVARPGAIPGSALASSATTEAMTWRCGANSGTLAAAFSALMRVSATLGRT